MTQELIDAPNIGQLIGGGTSADAVDRLALADRLISVFLRQIFTIGIFHADPHPGNILVEADGTIVLIDLGAVGRLSAGHREAVLDMLAAASMGNAAGLRQALGADHAVRPARRPARSWRWRWSRSSPSTCASGGGIDAAAFEDLTILIGRYGIRLPRWFGTLSRTLVTLEGTLKGLDPAFSLVDAAKRHANEMLPDIVGVDPQELLQPRADRRAAAAAADARTDRRAARPGGDRAPLGAAVGVRRRARRAARDPPRRPPRARPDRGRDVDRVGAAARCRRRTVRRRGRRQHGARLLRPGGQLVLAFRVVAGIIRDGET